MFGKAGLGGLMQQAQKMQENMKKAQAELAETEVEGQAGNGLVKVVMTCGHQVRKLDISSELIEQAADDKELLEDLLLAAFADAGAKVAQTTSDKMSKFTQGLPPGMGDFFKYGRSALMAKIGIVMGSNSDWPVMQYAANILQDFGVDYEARVVSAHRTPDLMFEYAKTAKERGLRAVIAGAGGAAHLPGMLASQTPLPVLGVPVPSKYLRGEDSLLSIVQMPKGVPVATFAIGEAGAANAALFAVSLLAADDEALAQKLDAFRRRQTETVLQMALPAAGE